jgi:Cytochrome c3
MARSPFFLLLRFSTWPAVLLFSFYLVSDGAPAQIGAGSSISLPTELRLQGADWWPRKAEAPREAYVGTATCAKCHVSKAAAQVTTAMAHASMSAVDSESLRKHPTLTFSLGPYNYELESNASKSTLFVRKEKDVRSHDLLWAFGFSHMGQTYLYEQNGDFYEAHLSFYSALQGLDITPGHERTIPRGFDDALGFRQLDTEIKRCFSCHTTASITKNEFNPAHAFTGVTCEACHGPGSDHVAAVKSGQGTGAIFNPNQLAPVDSVDFCGACHRTWQDVVGSGLTGVGVFNVRFAPYRLENSKCWQKTRSNLLTCVACHNPHQPLVHDSASYDSRCLQCHGAEQGGSKKIAIHQRACPVRTSDCVSCHMPKIEPPNLHSAFTDHWIRIIRLGKPYPN